MTESLIDDFPSLTHINNFVVKDTHHHQKIVCLKKKSHDANYLSDFVGNWVLSSANPCGLGMELTVKRDRLTHIDQLAQT